MVFQCEIFMWLNISLWYSKVVRWKIIIKKKQQLSTTTTNPRRAVSLPLFKPRLNHFMFASCDTTLFNMGPRSEDVLGILINICWRAIIGQGCSSYVKSISSSSSSSSRQQLCLSFILGWMTDCNPSHCTYLLLYLKKEGSGRLRHKIWVKSKSDRKWFYSSTVQ